MISPAALERERLRALAAVACVLPVDPWPPVPVLWNRRLRRAGHAVIEGRGRSFLRARIEISPAYFEVYPEDLLGILVHEAVHVGLAVCGLPFGHGPAFRAACAAAGGLLHGRAMPGRVFHYRCPACGGLIVRRRRIAKDRWCAPCVDRRRVRGEDPFAPRHALVLVGTAFSGPQARPAAGV